VSYLTQQSGKVRQHRNLWSSTHEAENALDTAIAGLRRRSKGPMSSRAIQVEKVRERSTVSQDNDCSAWLWQTLSSYIKHIKPLYIGVNLPF
jgi:hypothetical protein